MTAARPQRDAVDEEPARAGEPPDGEGVWSNPPPQYMTVMGTEGKPVRVDLDVLDGTVFAPHLDQLPVSPEVRQYVTQYCAMWSGSVLRGDGVRTQFPPSPRRGLLVFPESVLHAMLGLADDESVVAVLVEPLTSSLRFVVESPRLAPKEWNCEPPIIGLPISAWYEGRRGDGDVDGLAAARRQLVALESRAATSQQEWAEAIGEARRRVETAEAKRARVAEFLDEMRRPGDAS